MNDESAHDPHTGCGSCHCGPEETPQSGPAIPRRFFLQGAIAAFAALWGALAAYPLFRYMTTGQEEPVGADVKSVNLGKASEFPNNSARNFQFGRKPAILVRNPQGELHAFIAVCTHLGCTVQFSSEKEDIWCACHGGRYDLNSGKNMSGPPPKPLTPLKVATVKGDIIVSVA